MPRNKITIEMYQLESGMNMVDIMYNGKTIPGIVSLQLSASISNGSIISMLHAMKLNPDGSHSNLDLTRLLHNSPIEDKIRLSQEGDYILQPDEVIEAIRSGLMTNFLIPLNEQTTDVLDKYVSALRNGENLVMDDKMNPGYLTCTFVREKDLYVKLT
jgi:hypothetical protein